MFETLLMLVLFGVLMYFLIIRPQQKRMREHQETVNALQPGTRVLLQSGLHGTLTHIGDRQAIIELAPGLEVTILKAAIMRVVAEDEEEFEFDDDTVPGSGTGPGDVPEPSEQPAAQFGDAVPGPGDVPEPSEEPAAQDEATEKN